MGLPKNKLLRGWIKAISYLYDIPVEVASSSLNPFIEVVLRNGRFTLNTKLANYSFSSLHKVFQIALKDVSITKYHPQNILILGLGAGSIISIIRDEYGIKTAITAVELDPEILRLGKTYFGMDDYENLTIVEQDAYEFVQYCQDKFDLIIVDLFIDLDVPDKFISKEFLDRLKGILLPDGQIVFNTVVNTKKQKTNSIEVSHFFEGSDEVVIDVAGGRNRVIIYNKKEA